MCVKFSVETSTVSLNLSISVALSMLIAKDSIRGLISSSSNKIAISASSNIMGIIWLPFISVTRASVN